MRHVTFLRPNLGFGPPHDAMAPLVFAILKGLMPAHVETHLIDERVEPFAPVETDLVAITVETFTARRAYELADWYRARGVTVVMGGHHPSMCPDEAAAHADAVVVGDAESVWPGLLADVEAGRLRARYQGGMGLVEGRPHRPDRSVWTGRRYAPVDLVQAGSGCRFACDFCSIHAFYGTARAMRPPEEVAAEIAALPGRNMIFFTDDNLYWTRETFLALMAALAPLKRRWSCQITIDMARDDSLMGEMARAGCALVLIGFESLDAENRRQMRKNWSHVGGSYADVIARLHAHGIMVYGTFVFGYDADTPAAYDAAAGFALDTGLAIANFNPLTPMPGTGLYDRLKDNGQLLWPAWWVDPGYRYGDAIFTPRGMSPAALRDGAMRARSRFYAPGAILSRAARGLRPWGARNTGLMLLANVLSRREIARKQARALSSEAPVATLPEAAE
ncbi:MAG: radical SAM protein [Paracoccaceae bacterium]